MIRIRWGGILLALLAIGLLALGSPGSVAAEANDFGLGLQDNSGVIEPSDEPIVEVPGIVTLWLGSGFNSRDGRLNLETAQIDLPAINATATVNGFSFGLRDRSTNWDSISLTQVRPVENDAVTIFGTQANVQGSSANYSTDLATSIVVHPSEELQVGGTVGLSYDGMTGQTSFGVADGGAAVAVGPAEVMVQGVNAGDGAMAVEAAQVVAPEAGVGVRVDGFTVANGVSDWQALTFYGQEFNLGNAVTFSDNLVILPGPSSRASMPMAATTRFAVQAGDLVQADGQLVYGVDPTTGQPSVALLDGQAVLGVAGWTLAANGINTGQGSASVDTLWFTAEPLGVQTQVTGLSTNANGMTFEQARFLYQPAPSAEGSAVAGFELVVDNTDAGYIVTTTTVVPKAQN